MELYTMSPSGVIPEQVVEGYSSVIWTEKYSDLGEFQIKTPKIDEHLAQFTYFTIGRMVSHKDTNEVMMVDNFSIDTNEDGIEELTITGRSVTSLLEDRAVEGLRQPDPMKIPVFNSMELIGGMIWDAFGLGYNKDPLEPYPIISDIFQIPQACNVGGYVVTSTIHRALTGTPAEGWFVTPGETWAKVKDIMSLDRLGIRSIRPPWNAADYPGGTPTYELDYNAGTPPSVSYLGGGGFSTESKVQINIYTGIDRPNTIFNWDRGDISSAKYLISDKNYKNTCYVLSSTTAFDNIWVYVDGASDTTFLSFARRAMVIDPGVDQGSLTGPEYESLLIQAGTLELKKHRRDRLLDAAISVNTPYKYNVDYALGDTVTVMGDHGFFESMMVSEHTRTEDQEGDRDYPTLIRNELVE